MVLAVFIVYAHYVDKVTCVLRWAEVPEAGTCFWCTLSSWPLWKSQYHTYADSFWHPEPQVARAPHSCLCEGDELLSNILSSERLWSYHETRPINSPFWDHGAHSLQKALRWLHPKR